MIVIVVLAIEISPLFGSVGIKAFSDLLRDSNAVGGIGQKLRDPLFEFDLQRLHILEVLRAVPRAPYSIRTEGLGTQARYHSHAKIPSVSLGTVQIPSSSENQVSWGAYLRHAGCCCVFVVSPGWAYLRHAGFWLALLEVTQLECATQTPIAVEN